METSGGWQPGPAGMGSPGAMGGPAGMSGPGEVPGWPGTNMWVYPPGPYRRGSFARFLAWSALAGTAVALSLVALAALVIPHTILLVILVLLALPVLLVALAAGVVFWVGRRAWRSGAWMEAVPVAAGLPAAGRLVWLLRALLVGKALRRLGRRGRRSRGGYQRSRHGRYADYRIVDR